MNHVHRKLRARLEAAAIIAAVLIGIALALPANAAGCETYDFQARTFSGQGDGLYVSWVTQDVDSQLWVNTGEFEADADLGVGSVAHSVPADAVTATVCPDGSVSFAPATVADVVEAPADEPEPVVVGDAAAQPAELVEPQPVIYPATAARLAALVG